MFGLAGFMSSKGGNIEDMLARTSSYTDGKVCVYKSEGCVLGIKQLSSRFDDGMAEYETAKGFAIAFNGKIYNREELITEIGITPMTDQDAELVVLGYKKLGKDIVNKLKGMFAFAVYDAAEKQIAIARDGCGMRQIYYYHNGDDFVFASNTKAFEGFEGFKKELNEKVLSPFLCFGSVPTKETFIKNVFRLEPGHILTFKDGNLQKECFFALEFNTVNKPITEHAEDIHMACESSVKAHAKGNFGSFLSGGVDSSYIASVARPKVTFTAGYTDAKYDETEYTKELADILGIENAVKTVSPEEVLAEYKDVIACMDEPLSNPSLAPIYFGTKAAADRIDIIFSGEGADELFAGYHSYKEELTHSGYMKIPFAIRHFIYLCTKWIPSSKFDFFARRGQHLRDFHIGTDRVFKDKDAQKIVKLDHQLNTRDVTAEYYDRYANCTSMQQRQAIDFYFWLVNDFVYCVAKFADHFGIESRFPLLSKDVVKTAVSLPDEYKLGGEMTKVAFRMAAKKAIPNDAYCRKKLGFPVPLKEWIKREDYYNAIKDKFGGETAKKFFDTQAILALLDNHKNGKGDNYKKIWAVYTFILWYELNF